MIGAIGFSASSVEVLGKRINDWLEDNKFEVVDIQYRIFEGELSRYDEYRYTALLTYENGKEYHS